MDRGRVRVFLCGGMMDGPSRSMVGPIAEQFLAKFNIKKAFVSCQGLDLERGLSVTADGKYHWNETTISDEELEPRLQAEAQKDPQPDLHIRGDKDVRYERVAQAMSAAQRAGVRKIGFVTDPAQ